MFPLQEPYIPFQQEYTVDSNIPNKQRDWLIKITWVFRKAGNRIINDKAYNKNETNWYIRLTSKQINFIFKDPFLRYNNILTDTP